MNPQMQRMQMQSRMMACIGMDVDAVVGAAGADEEVEDADEGTEDEGASALASGQAIREYVSVLAHESAGKDVQLEELSAERARMQADLQRLGGQLADAQGDVAARDAELGRVRAQLVEARAAVFSCTVCHSVHVAAKRARTGCDSCSTCEKGLRAHVRSQIGDGLASLHCPCGHTTLGAAELQALALGADMDKHFTAIAKAAAREQLLDGLAYECGGCGEPVPRSLPAALAGVPGVVDCRMCPRCLKVGCSRCHCLLSAHAPADPQQPQQPQQQR